MGRFLKMGKLLSQNERPFRKRSGGFAPGPAHLTAPTNRRKASRPAGVHLKTPAWSKTRAKTSPISCRRISSTLFAVKECFSLS